MVVLVLCGRSRFSVFAGLRVRTPFAVFTSWLQDVRGNGRRVSV